MLRAASAFQEPPPARGWLAELAATPGFVETLLAIAVVAVAVLLWWRAAKLLAQTRRRRAVGDYLFGVEQALCGDLKGARTRLQKVLAEDPENHYAQMLLGQVLSDLGEPEKAHRHHLTLRSAFEVESGQNDLLMARCLLELDHPAEAADVAERAAVADPESAALWQFVFRARLRAGEHTGAARAGQRWLAVLRDAAALPGARAEVADALARGGTARLLAGEHQAAQEALAQAKSLAPALPEVARLSARLMAHAHGTEATVQALLGDGKEPTGTRGNNLLPVPAAASPLVAVTAPTQTLQALARLMPQSRWRCAACGGELPGRVPVCPACGARERAEVGEPRLFDAVDSPGQCMDAIDENRAHLARVVRRALSDPDAAIRQRARGEVLLLGEKAVPELLAEAWQSHDDGPALDLLRELGPAITPALFAAADDLSQGRLIKLPLHGRSPMALVGRVVQGFDRSALPHFEGLFGSARPEHRRVLIDYFLGLGDPAEFQLVLERFPPLEILHRMNQAETEVLRRFLAAVPGGHFVAEVLIAHPNFRREADVLLAIPEAVHGEGLERALHKRGPSRSLNAALVEGLADAALRPVARRILAAFGIAALDLVLETFADLEAEPAVRNETRGLLVSAGPSAVERLCAAFGPEPSGLDDELRAVLARIGANAVPGLETAYGKRDWLEKLSAGFLQRHGNRRQQIVQALADIGGVPAGEALRRLRRQEADQNLRLCLERALHRVSAEQGGAR